MLFEFLLAIVGNYDVSHLRAVSSRGFSGFRKTRTRSVRGLQNYRQDIEEKTKKKNYLQEYLSR